MRPILSVAIAMAAVAGPSAQAPPTSPAGTGTAPLVRAAGMPLADGALAPGTLTVRLVRGNFAGNVTDVDVDLDVSGEGAKRARTGADGRATFAHLPVGARVRAAATVGGERLQSEPFTMPTESGVRLLFVTGDAFVDTTSAASATPTVAAAPPGTSPTNAGPAGESAAGTAAARPLDPVAHVATFRVVMVVLTALAFAAVGYTQWKGRRSV